jgi:hypothetical protein
MWLTAECPGVMRFDFWQAERGYQAPIKREIGAFVRFLRGFFNPLAPSLDSLKPR